IHSYNVIYRNNTLDGAKRMLQLKMRHVTTQEYENILNENVKCTGDIMLFIRAWTQFFDLKGEEGIKLSYAQNITLRNIDLECNVLFDVSNSNQYELSDFTFENMKIKAKRPHINQDFITNFTLKNVVVNGKEVLQKQQ